MAEIKQLTTDRDRHIADARNVLQECLDSGFEAVVVIGIKNGSVWTKKSATVDTLSFLGACEIAKQYILQKWVK